MEGITTYRVLPVGNAWKIELAGDSVTEWSDTKAEAIARARVLAGRAPRGAVVVLDALGVVETEIELDTTGRH